MMEPRACPDAETLAAWIEGRLAEDERRRVAEHVAGCADCIELVDFANETFHAEGVGAPVIRPARWQRWLLAAAAVLAVAIPLSLFVRLRSSDPVQELVAVAPRSARPVEARLSGGFAWAPYRGAMRTGADADREQMKLMGVAAEVLDRAERDPSPETERAAATAMVLIGRADEGMARLIAETKRAPDDARAWNDLAAAHYAAALNGRASLYPAALASADRALAIDPRFAEALFNRALILERMGLREPARAAWRRYLDHDASSPWAKEAREHLARLGATRDPRPFDADREQLEKAAAAGDAARVRTLVARHAERARAFAEVEYLGRWAEAVQRHDTNEAARWLAIARGIGDGLAQTSGESLLRDAVQAIDAADAPRRSGIAAAHAVYRRGRLAYSRRELSVGERDLRFAARQFAAEGDAMALAARSYAASARLAQNDVVAARRELSELLGELEPGYLSLGGQVRWELGRSLMFDGDWRGAAQALAEAEALFGRAGETGNQATIAVMLAAARAAEGRPDEAWSVRTRAFETLAAAGRIDQLQAAVGAAAAEALRAGRRESAAALIGAGESLARSSSNDLLLADMLTRKSLLAPSPREAVRAAVDAAAVARRIGDPALRTRHLADADLAMAAALLATDARRARDLASRAIDTYSANAMTALVAEPYLVRARASLRLGDRESASRDLAAGMASVEQHSLGDAIGTGVLDAGRALFEEAIRLDVERGDVASAFAHVERSRGFAAGPEALGELRARLRGSGTAVLVVSVLPREVMLIAITAGGASMARQAMARDDAIALVNRGDDAALHDLLIKPAAAALANARALIVVPDKVLERVAYAALRDAATDRPLVERMAVAMAPSASALRIAPAAPRPAAMTAIELPAGSMAPLPEAEAELAEIGRLYRDVRRVRPGALTPRALEESGAAADVLHIAGHTEEDVREGGQSLAGAISWRTIAGMRGMPPVVVLSACNTVRRPDDPDRRALSLAGAFAAAGAADVVGALAPIGDRDARSLFLALHEELARGVAPNAALRRVQLAHRERPGGAWRHLALLTTTIHPATD